MNEFECNAITFFDFMGIEVRDDEIRKAAKYFRQDHNEAIEKAAKWHDDEAERLRTRAPKWDDPRASNYDTDMADEHDEHAAAIRALKVET